MRRGVPRTEYEKCKDRFFSPSLALHSDGAVLSIGEGKYAIIRGVGGNDMSIMIDLPPAMAQEAQDYATVRGTTLDRMVHGGWSLAVAMA